MGELLSKVIPLSIGAAFSPTVLALELLILSGKRSKARSTAFLAGVLLVFVGITALGLAISHTTSTSPAQETITKTVDVVAGAFLLLLALATLLRSLVHDSVAPVDGEAKDARNPGLLSAFLLGLAIMASNFSTILLYVPAMRSISASTISTSDKILAVAIAFLVAAAPILLIYGFAVAFPKVATPPLEKLRGWINRHQRTIGISVEVIFGIYLIYKALK